MNIKTLIRDPSKIHECLRELPDGRLIAKKTVKIYIPIRFIERNLASIGIDVNIVGIFAITTEDNYLGVSMVNAMMRIEPTSTMKIDIDDIGYYEFTFEPGSTVISNVNLVKTDAILYRIYDEIIGKGNVPWYLNYSDLGKIFDSARYHAGANIGGNHEVTELMVSLIARNKDDRHTYYRQTVEKLSDLSIKPPAYISLRNVTYAASNTTNKLAGSYASQGIISALNSPSTREERISKILRK